MRRPAASLCISAVRWKTIKSPIACARRLNTSSSSPIVRLNNATFYRRHPSSLPPAGQEAAPNPPLFPSTTLELPSKSTPNQHWAILSPSSAVRTAFLNVLRGQYLCEPPTARSYPYLSSPEIAAKNIALRNPEKAIQYVGFDAERQAFGGAYLSARYESHVDPETDFTLAQFLTGITGRNLTEEFLRENTPDRAVMLKVVKDLELERFFDKPVNNLSNGQSRRARIGKALLSQPELLLLDAPFIGLDPFVTKHMSGLLHRLAEERNPRILLSLRPQDAIPEWITHLVYAGADAKIQALGPKEEVVKYLSEKYVEAERAVKEHAKSSSAPAESELLEMREVGRHMTEGGSFQGLAAHEMGNQKPVLSRDGFGIRDEAEISPGEPLIEMQGVQIKYGDNMALGNWKQEIEGNQKDGLWWSVHRGQRWGIFGANGSGKTTLLALLTSDHPQTYSAPIRIFQRSRLPSPGKPGISIFDIQARMGHASPEVHSFFPKQLSIRRTLESAYADTPLSKPSLSREATERIEACLRWFQADLNPTLGMTELQKNELASPPDENESAEALATRLGSALEAEQDPSSLKWAENITFGELSLSSQRVALFLRAVVRNPDIVILDEAFSGMDDLTRDRCLLFLSRGDSMTLHYDLTTGEASPRESYASRLGRSRVQGLTDDQALLIISHNREEVPGCVREWICLPEPGQGIPPRFGKLDGPIELEPERWNEIWNWEGKRL